MKKHRCGSIIQHTANEANKAFARLIITGGKIRAIYSTYIIPESSAPADVNSSNLAKNSITPLPPYTF